MNGQFHTIGLIGKQGDPRVQTSLSALVDFLRVRGLDVMLETSAQTRVDVSGVEKVPLEEIAAACDLAVVVGGDGTMLYAARTLSLHGTPLIGINLGRLGFLADISPGDTLQAMDRLLAGEYQEERRFLLDCCVLRDGQTIGAGNALNDVVVHKWNVARMIELETRINGAFVNTQRSDGLIVSTPTGSTAYALSGGGPILQPTLDAVLLVPICPHTLSNRPLVVGADSIIEVLVRNNPEGTVRVSCDGVTLWPVRNDDKVIINKSNRVIRLLHPLRHDQFDIMRAKLGWSGNP